MVLGTTKGCAYLTSSLEPFMSPLVSHDTPSSRAETEHQTAPPSASPQSSPARRSRGWATLKGLLLVCSLILFARTLGHADWSAVGTRLARLGPWALFAFVPFPVALALDSYAWKLLLQTLGFPQPLSRLFRVRLSTEAVTFTFPAGGLFAEALGPFLLSPGVAPEASLAASATKRWLIFRMHGVYLLLALAVGFPYLSASAAALHVPGLPWVVGAVGVTFFTLAIVLERVTGRFGVASRLHDGMATLPLQSWLRWLGAHRGSFVALDSQFAILAKHPARTPPFLVLAAWVLESVETFIILRLLGVDLSFAAVVSLDASLSVVRTAAIFAPAGLGVQDVGYLAFFSAYGVHESALVGPAFLIMKRTKELFYVSIGLGLFALARRRARLTVPSKWPTAERTA